MSVVPISTGVSTRDDQATRLRAMLGTRGADQQPMIVRPRPKLIALASGKGGVGKTYTSISLATAIADMGQRTVLVDADFGAANADIMLGLAPLRRLDECFVKGFSRGHSVGDIAIESGAGFRLIPGPVGMGRPPAAADRNRLLASYSQLHDDTDVVLMDCSAGVGPCVLDLVSAADLSVIVLTPEPTSIADAYALVKSLIRKQGPQAAETLGLVVNQTESRSEAERVHRRIAAVAHRFLGVTLPLLGRIPADKSVSRGIRAQRVAQGGKLRSSSGRSVRKAAKVVLDQIQSREQAGQAKANSADSRGSEPNRVGLELVSGR
ncbi:MAG: AAA family ATPase [Phycisphaerales bacterium JB061]